MAGFCHKRWLAVSKYVNAIKLVQKSSICKPAYYFKETEDKMEVFFFLNDLNIYYTFVIALFFSSYRITMAVTSNSCLQIYSYVNHPLY